MPMTQKEKAQLEALEAKRKADQEEEEGYSLDVTLANGHKVHYTGAQARAYAKRHGLEEDLQAPEGEDKEETDDPDPEPAGTEGYFKKRK
jgi:hypothetical protein